MVAAPMIERAGADGVGVSGTFTYTTSPPTACGVAVLCATGAFHGGIEGAFTNTITSLAPSPVVGVDFFSGQITIRTDRGNLACGLAGALDSTSKDGEFGEICVINAGTGVYKDASGHLQLTGMTPTKVVVVPANGFGQYTGTLIAPNLPST